MAVPSVGYLFNKGIVHAERGTTTAGCEVLSVDVEIAADDELPGVVLHHVGLQFFRRQAVVVIEDEQSRLRGPGKFPEQLGRSAPAETSAGA